MWTHIDSAMAESRYPIEGGIRFECALAQVPEIKQALSLYFSELRIDQSHWLAFESGTGIYQLTLASAPQDTDTLGLAERKDLGITSETIALPSNSGERLVKTVSQKEIVLALMQRGRTTVFKNEHCRATALREHVALRQNIVAWGQELEWKWPNGGPARWNTTYWTKGTPVPGHPLPTALLDVFLNQSQYTIGCYTAIKLVMVHGIVDYYHRLDQDRNKYQRVQMRLLHDGEPLLDIEPNAMWSFEPGFNYQTISTRGKLLEIQHDIPSNNFIPGDWAYIINTDPKTARKTGYEGSNALYLGGNQFADFFNDHGHAISSENKLQEVYQWRLGVFSAERDYKKVRKLSQEKIKNLSKTPKQGGLLLDYRVIPRID